MVGHASGALHQQQRLHSGTAAQLGTASGRTHMAVQAARLAEAREVRVHAARCGDAHRFLAQELRDSAIAHGHHQLHVPQPRGVLRAHSVPLASVPQAARIMHGGRARGHGAARGERWTHGQVFAGIAHAAARRQGWAVPPAGSLPPLAGSRDYFSDTGQQSEVQAAPAVISADAE